MHLIEGIDYFVHKLPLPWKIGGSIVRNPDGTCEVYLNSNHPLEMQYDSLDHELYHMANDHLYDDSIPLEVKEAEAENYARDRHVRVYPN